ncbi:hypothetical protein HYX10_01160 [Candidatus Woesearchaeota archaeon]|nr:hypothetical protein [Candidatus Woesearchaeota archaeon]
MGDVKKSYDVLRKQFKLPKFEELAEFQLSELEEEFLLADIRRGMLDKVQNFLDFLSEILSPDTNLSNMYESRVFDDIQKKEVFDVFRRLMYWKRQSLQVEITNDNAVNAEFITSFLEEWSGLKKRLADIIDKVKDSWESDSESTEKLGYFG